MRKDAIWITLAAGIIHSLAVDNMLQPRHDACTIYI